MKKITKGCLVKLNVDLCFTFKNGGLRKYPHSTDENDNHGAFEGIRLANTKDVKEWNKQPYSKGLTSAGESRLPPTAFLHRVYKNRVYTVIKARCRGRWSYRTWPGQTLLLDTYTGYEIYVDRNVLEVV
jgi:hypothetical protein